MYIYAFQLIIGQKYGKPILPKHISVAEFEALIAHLSNDDDVEFMQRHFLLDENSRPARFELNLVESEDAARVQFKLKSLLKV